MHKLPEIKRLLIVTDAAAPQVNGVVRTIGNTTRHLEAMGVEVQMLTPERFRTIACPSYAEIRLSLTTSRTVERIIDEINPDALHVSTEGPLGWHARSAALRRGWKFTTAFHTRFPEYVHARTGIPPSWVYKVFKRFHGSASAVLAPTDQQGKPRFSVRRTPGDRIERRGLPQAGSAGHEMGCRRRPHRARPQAQVS